MDILLQSDDKRLYPDLEWERPERKNQAGRLLIIGGNLHGFAAPAQAFGYAQEAGVGTIRVLLPDALRRTLAPTWADAQFCPSTPSGSFAKDSSEIILNNLLWADGVLLAGDFGRNSETAIVLEQIMSTLGSWMVITKDALDYFLDQPEKILKRQQTVVVGSFSQLQHMFSKLHKDPKVFRFSMPLVNLCTELGEYSQEHNVSIITKFENQYITASAGKVSVTKKSNDEEIWRLKIAAKASVNLLHFPGKVFEALNAAYF